MHGARIKRSHSPRVQHHPTCQLKVVSRADHWKESRSSRVKVRIYKIRPCLSKKVVLTTTLPSLVSAEVAGNSRSWKRRGRNHVCSYTIVCIGYGHKKAIHPNTDIIGLVDWVYLLRCLKHMHQSLDTCADAGSCSDDTRLEHGNDALTFTPTSPEFSGDWSGL